MGKMVLLRCEALLPNSFQCRAHRGSGICSKGWCVKRKKKKADALDGKEIKLCSMDGFEYQSYHLCTLPDRQESSRSSWNISGVLLTVLLKVQTELLFHVSWLFYTNQNTTWAQELPTQPSRNFFKAHTWKVINSLHFLVFLVYISKRSLKHANWSVKWHFIYWELTSTNKWNGQTGSNTCHLLTPWA